MLDAAVTAAGSAGLAGAGFTVALTVGRVVLGDARRTGDFFTGFFAAVLGFLRALALLIGVFLRFALALPLVFFLVAMMGLPHGLPRSGFDRLQHRANSHPPLLPRQEGMDRQAPSAGAVRDRFHLCSSDKSCRLSETCGHTRVIGPCLLRSALLLNFPESAGSVSVPGIAIGADKAAFVAEGAPIPVHDLFTNAALSRAEKIGNHFQDEVIE